MMDWPPQKRRNKSPRWRLPENSTNAWMQQACSQQRIIAEARQSTVWRSSERCLREALAKLGDNYKSTHYPRQHSKSPSRPTRPRQLTPLIVKPSAATLQDKEHALQQLQQSELKLRLPKKETHRRRAGANANSAPKSPLLAIPLHPEASATSSSGSSSASSPLPDTVPSAATLSAQSRESIYSTTDQSPLTHRRGRLSPLKPASVSIRLQQAPPLSIMQRTPSPQNITFCGKQNPPFISPVSPINPKPRPANPASRTRTFSPYAIRQRPKHKKAMAAKPSTAVGESEPKAAGPEQAQSAAPTAVNSNCSHNVCTVTEGPDRSYNGLTIPQITIRFPTPAPAENTHCTFVLPAIAIRAATPTPGDEEAPLANLCDQFVFRAELTEELGMLRSDLQHLSGNAAPDSEDMTKVEY